jgi:hypothetical protein
MRIGRLLAPIFLGALAVAALVLGTAAASSSSSKVLEFDTMAPVVAPFTGSTNAIRGVPGGGLPWQLTSATGELSTGGRLEIKVEGLVLVATGANPIASFRGVVNCLTPNSPTNGVNIVTAPVPATSTGNAEIEAQLELPSPCIAPIVFVTNGTAAAPGAWFAATGTA